MAAKLQLEKQRRLDEEHNRQAALLKARKMAAEKKKEKFSEYGDEFLMSPGTSPRLPNPPASPIQISQDATESGATVQLERAVPSQKSVASTKISDVTEYSLPGQVHVTDESDKVTNDGSETGSLTSGAQRLTADKETNTSMFLLQGLTHLIPAASQAADHTIVAEGFPESTTSVQSEQSHVMSTASQTGLSMADIAEFTEELENEQGGLDAGESQEVDEEDYLEAVEEVQVAISQELLESAIRMTPQISEAIVERVASLGPEAMQVLEEIRSKLSVRSQPGSGLQSREPSTLSFDAGQTPTHYPNASSLSISQTKSSTSSYCSNTPSGKVVPLHQSINPPLQSSNEGINLTDQHKESACALEPPQEDIPEESAERCHGEPPRSNSISTAGSSTNQQCLSWLSTRVAKDTAKALIDQIFCEVVQHPMFQDKLSGGSQQAHFRNETTEEADASLTGEFECVERKSISVPSPSINLYNTTVTSPSGSSVILQTTVSEIPLHESGSSSKAFFQQTNSSSRLLSPLKDHASTASTKQRSPAPSYSNATTQADKKASSSSVQSTRSVKDRLSSQASVSAGSSSSRSRPASKASVVSQKVSFSGAPFRATMSSSAASKLNAGASSKSFQGVSSQQSGPASVKKSEVAMGTSTKTMETADPVSSQSSVKSSGMGFTKQSNMSSVGGHLPTGALEKSVCSMVSRPDSQTGSQLSKSSMRLEFHQSPVQSSQTLPLTPQPSDQATPLHSQAVISSTPSFQSAGLRNQSSKRSSASLSAGESVSCDHPSKSVAEGMEQVLYEKAEAPPTDAEAVKDTGLGCESVTVPDNFGADVEEANQPIVTIEIHEEELQDADTPNGDSKKDSSMNSMASSGSLPQDVFAREASAEDMERAPSRHADSAISNGQGALLPTLSANAKDTDQCEPAATQDNISGLLMEEAGAVTAFDGGDTLVLQEEEIQHPEDGVMEVPKQESAVAAGGGQEGGSEEQIGDGEDPAPTLTSSRSLAKKRHMQPPSKCSTPAVEGSTSDAIASQRNSSSVTDGCAEEDINELRSESASQEEVATKAICQSEEEPMLQEITASSAKQPSNVSIVVESNTSAASVGKPSSSTASVSVRSKASTASVIKPPSKQASTASVSVRLKASTASVGKPSSKQASTASVSVEPNASVASVGKPSSKQASTASVSVEPNASAASVGKPSSKQPSTASVSVGSKASTASVGKPPSKQASTASVSVGSKASTASVGKPPSKQPSTVSVSVEPNASAASVGKPSSKQPSTVSVSVEPNASAASVGKPSSKQASTASVSVEPNASVASVGKPPSKQPSTASVSVGSKASTASVGKPPSKQASTASASVGLKASTASVGKPSSKQASTASVSVGSKASTASVGKPSSKQPSTASVSVEPNASAASVGKPSSKQPSTASVGVELKASTASVGRQSSKQRSTTSVGMESNVSAAGVGSPSSKQPSTASVGAVGSKVSVGSMDRLSSKQPSVAAVAIDRAVNESPSSCGVAQPAVSMDSSELSITATNEVLSEKVAQTQPTGGSDGESAGCVDEVPTREPTVLPAKGSSLSCKEAPPGSDKDDSAAAPVSQLVSKVTAGESTIITEPVQDQASTPRVQASALSLGKDSLETVGSETTVAKEMICSTEETKAQVTHN